MEGFGRFLLILILFAAFLGYALIRRLVLSRKNRVCPVCGHLTEIRRRAEHKDTCKDGPIKFAAGKYIVSGHAASYWSVICCPECGYEVRI